MPNIVYKKYKQIWVPIELKVKIKAAAKNEKKSLVQYLEDKLK